MTASGWAKTALALLGFWLAPQGAALAQEPQSQLAPIAPFTPSYTPHDLAPFTPSLPSAPPPPDTMPNRFAPREGMRTAPRPPNEGRAEAPHPGG